MVFTKPASQRLSANAAFSVCAKDSYSFRHSFVISISPTFAFVKRKVHLCKKTSPKSFLTHLDIYIYFCYNFIYLESVEATVKETVCTKCNKAYDAAFDFCPYCGQKNAPGGDDRFAEYE